jgi:tRNA threonylcarbamoyladenosine biosynthesis protein TsaE
VVFALSGELGTGKTAFVQGFLSGLGIRRRAISPTFILIRRFGRVYHMDAYRIKSPEEFAKLGWANILSDPRNIVLLEWADKVKRLVPKDAVWIKFWHGGAENERVIQIKSRKPKAKNDKKKSETGFKP